MKLSDDSNYDRISDAFNGFDIDGEPRLVDLMQDDWFIKEDKTDDSDSVLRPGGSSRTFSRTTTGGASEMTKVIGPPPGLTRRCRADDDDDWRSPRSESQGPASCFDQPRYNQRSQDSFNISPQRSQDNISPQRSQDNISPQRSQDNISPQRSQDNISRRNAWTRQSPSGSSCGSFPESPRLIKYTSLEVNKSKENELQLSGSSDKTSNEESERMDIWTNIIKLVKEPNWVTYAILLILSARTILKIISYIIMMLYELF
eukprot:GHVL01023993.1.p1 GENE.GHVL01023993.1~~GHVL01023993.1.p1  ORF type:complete len:259 (+),score=54.01 GHVL01023993.1:72-848(+)